MSAHALKSGWRASPSPSMWSFHGLLAHGGRDDCQDEPRAFKDCFSSGLFALIYSVLQLI